MVQYTQPMRWPGRLCWRLDRSRFQSCLPPAPRARPPPRGGGGRAACWRALWGWRAADGGLLMPPRSTMPAPPPLKDAVSTLQARPAAASAAVALTPPPSPSPASRPQVGCGAGRAGAWCLVGLVGGRAGGRRWQRQGRG